MRTAPLEDRRVPEYYESKALEVAPLDEHWVLAHGSGAIARVHVKAGQSISTGRPLISLAVSPNTARQKRGLEAAEKKKRTALERGQEKHARVAKALAEARARGQQALAERRRFEQVVPAEPSPAHRARQRQLQAAELITQRKLDQLIPQEKRLAARLAQLKQKHDAAAAKLALVATAVDRSVIRADRPGQVMSVAVTPGQIIGPDSRVALLSDTTGAILTFGLPPKTAPAVGAPCHVGLKDGTLVAGEVLAVTTPNSTARVTVRVNGLPPDAPRGDPSGFRLVRHFITPAFRVPATAVVETHPGTAVFVTLAGHARSRPVEILRRDQRLWAIRDLSGTLRSGQSVVVACAGPTARRVAACVKDGTPILQEAPASP